MLKAATTSASASASASMSASMSASVSARRGLVLALVATLWASIGVCASAAPAAAASVRSAYVEFGANLGPVVTDRIKTLLKQAGVDVLNVPSDVSSLGDSAWVLSFGNATLSSQYLDISAVGVASEGYSIKTFPLFSGATLLAVNGAPLIPSSGKKYALDVNNVHYGAVMGSYQLLEQLGFAFIHPLQPFIPEGISVKTVDTVQNPRWPMRTWHVHTQHPLEFHEVLNGFDIPMFDKSGENTSFTDRARCPPHTYCESFESMLPQLAGLFEWAVASGQNRIESLLLGNKKWELRDESVAGMGATRQARLKQINDMAHSYGLLMGADIPIAFMQQHAWAIIR
jgi:hypothetical protein